MKKHYGPIVLGIIALTLAAPVSNVTTVLAEETPEEQQGGEEYNSVETPLFIEAYNVSNGDEFEIDIPTQTFKIGENEYKLNNQYTVLDPTNDKDTVKDNIIKVNITEDGNFTITSPVDKDGRIHVLDSESSISEDQMNNYLTQYNNLLDNYKKQLSAYNGSNTTLDNLIKDAPEKATSFTGTPDYSEKTNTLQKLSDNLNTTVPSNEITASVKNADGKELTVSASNVPIVSGEETTGIEVFDNGTSVGKIDLTAEGVVEPVSPLQSSDKKEVKVSASKDSIDNAKKKTDFYLNVLNSFSTDNPDALKEFTKPLSDIMDKLEKDSITAKEVNDLLDQANNYYNDNQVMVSIKNVNSGSTLYTKIPLLKGSTVYTRSVDGSEYIGITFNNDGKITAAKLTDANHKDIYSNSKFEVKINDSSDAPIIAIGHKKSSNDKKPETNKPEVEKPDITPKHTKSITNHSTNFYSLPNTITTLFDENGNALKNRALGEDSTWYADKLLKLDGVNYLRVATGEWAKLADGLEVTPISQNVFTKNQSRLYTANGDIVTNRALAEDTAWRTDKSATINGQTMYRVATNEWVRASDLI